VKPQAKQNLQGLYQLFERAESATERKDASSKLNKMIQGVRELFQNAQKLHQLKQRLKNVCERWEKDKTHNPFNKTKRGRKLNANGKTYKHIEQRCKDKKTFCDKVKNNKKLKEKYCQV
jgi:type VI protein secretion system component VasF